MNKVKGINLCYILSCYDLNEFVEVRVVILYVGKRLILENIE